ncbi:Translation initiation factor 2 (IF-2; GTPase), partial [hydrothermal vent metagenome]
KPNFALILSSDGIGLLHRSVAGVAEGWNTLGDASLEGDDPGADLGKTLTALREKAAEFEPSGLHCMLVLPNDQVKYITLPRADMPGDDPQKSALDALEGATPYAVAALVVDWSLGKDHLHIAAVARETLTEAENFATQHGFKPVCFVAVPATGDFSGAPYFGVASTHDAGDPIERDKTPVRATGSAFMPKAVLPEITVTPTSTGTAPNEAPDDPPGETSGETSTAAFTSVRAHGDNLPDTAPKLDGAARFFGAEDVNAPPVDIPTGLPKTPAEPNFTGVTDAALPDEPAPEPDTPPTPVTAKTGAAPAVEPIKSNTEKPPHPAPVKPAGPAPAPTDIPTSEKARMTVFGARDSSKSGTISKRSWLGLVALVVISMIGLASLASMTFKDGLAELFRGSDRAQITDIPSPAAPPQTDPPQTDPPQPAIQTQETIELATDDTASETPINSTGIDPKTNPETNPETDPIDQTVIAPSTPDDTPLDETVIASLPPAGLPTKKAPEIISPAQKTLTLPEPAELTPDEARARYAATGIWQMAPVGPQAPTAANLEKLYQAAIDTPVDRPDVIALSVPRSTDTRPLTLLSPPDPGTEFNRDARGLVIAAQDGALTPDGIRVYAGKPVLIPPVRPGTPAQSATGGGVIDPALLRQTRPRPRPDDLAEQRERSILGGRTRAELAKLRPKLRPQSAQEAAALAAAGAGSAIDAALSEAALSGLTAQAITASLRPATRPKGFSKTVAQIRAAQQPQVTPGQPLNASAVAVVTPTPTGPSIPTSALISQAATDEKAIKLRKINLIGVYGTPNSRRALVRLPNGRYRKVVIGDRLDGGKVAAIGDNELRYIKRGRNVVLKLPQG